MLLCGETRANRDIPVKTAKNRPENHGVGLFLFPPSACFLPVIHDQVSSNLRIKVERQLWFWEIKSSLLTHLGDEPFRIRDIQFN
jgi:hypothetical protein